MAFMGSKAHIPFATPGGGRRRQILAKLNGATNTLKPRELCDNDWNDAHEERIYRTETNISRQRENSFSYPWDMMTSLQPYKASNIPSSPKPMSSRVDLHHHEHNDNGSRCFVEWSTDNEMNVQEKRLIADTHYDIAQAMVKSIDESKHNDNDFSLLTKATHIQGPDKMDEKDLCDDNYWNNINNGKFEIRLDFEYDEWMRDKEKYQAKFVSEVCTILGVESKEIAIDNYRRGSTKFRMSVGKIWSLYKTYIKNVDHAAVQRDYIRNIRAQDQISVKWGNDWYTATVTTVFDDDGNGKHFQVRFNPLNDNNGWDPFYWNTEWFYSKREAARLTFPGQFHNVRDREGQDIPIQWRPPPLAVRGNTYDIQVNDHVFVKFGEHDWRRCMVYKKQRKYRGFSINVKALKTGKTKRLNLWETLDRNKISLEDMRG